MTTKAEQIQRRSGRGVIRMLLAEFIRQIGIIDAMHWAKDSTGKEPAFCLLVLFPTSASSAAAVGVLPGRTG